MSEMSEHRLNIKLFILIFFLDFGGVVQCNATNVISCKSNYSKNVLANSVKIN